MVPEKAISPHLIFWFEACPDFAFQYILMKIDENVANTIEYNLSKAFSHILKSKKIVLNLVRGKNHAFKKIPFTE